MNTLLVPIDFSPGSINTLNYARGLARPFNARIIVLHVHNPGIADPNILFSTIGPVAISEPGIIPRMKEFITQLPEGPDEPLTWEFEVRTGLASEEILNTCHSAGPALIIMGMNSRKDINQRLLGSTTSRVIQRAICPVLVVPENAEFTGIRKIGYATNFEEGDLAVLDCLLGFAKVFDARIHCVHIRDEANQKAVVKQEIFAHAFRHDLTIDSLSFEDIDYDHIVSGLNTYVKDQNIDLFVMLTHHRNIVSQLFHKSHTQQMAQQTDVPLWVFQMDQGIQQIFSNTSS